MRGLHNISTVGPELLFTGYFPEQLPALHLNIPSLVVRTGCRVLGFALHKTRMVKLGRNKCKITYPICWTTQQGLIAIQNFLSMNFHTIDLQIVPQIG